MIQASAGQILMNQDLPEDLRDHTRVLDKKGVETLFRSVAEKHPEKYKNILHAFMKHGADFAGTSGVSVSLRHLVRGPRVTAAITKLKAENQVDIDDDAITDKERDARIVARTSAAYAGVEAANMADQKESGSPLYTQVISGGRGNPAQLNQITGAELLVADHRNQMTPMPVYSSYADGLDPAEYWASSYGTRRGIVSVKFATPKAGFLGKQLSLAAHRQVVNREKPHEHRLPVGLPVPVDDEGNIGAVLAKDAGGHPAGTVLTGATISALRNAGIEDILIHSPMTAADPDGGVDSWSAGARDRGELARIGDNIGVTAAQAISEPLSQGALCLAEGTLVLLVNGGSAIPIEQITPGTEVLGANVQGDTFPVKVLRKFFNGPKKCHKFTFWTTIERSVSVQCTADHKFLTSRGVVPVIATAERICEAVMADDIRSVLTQIDAEEELPTWDIEVDHPDHLFVLANGLIVSNSEKHSAGGGKIGKKLGGFDFINKLLQGPEFFAETGPLTPATGSVRSVEAAPQGGHFVTVGDHELYVRPEHAVTVKPGDHLEIGDEVSDGIPHPADLVKYRGVGEARRVFLGLARDAFKASGVKVHRRNLEPVIAGLINHVQITDPNGAGDHTVDDVVPYNRLAATYVPRQGATPATPKRSMGRYLEEPVLQYSVGTPVTKRVVKDLEKWDIPDVITHEEAPGFAPQWERLMTNTSRDPDWQTRLSGFYTGRALLHSVHEGATSDTRGTSFFPGVAQASGFGKDLTTKGTY